MHRARAGRRALRAARRHTRPTQRRQGVHIGVIGTDRDGEGGRGVAWCLLLVCACFTLTSEGWIRWHYHLLDFVDARTADALALVVGYLLQAAGMGVGAALARWRPGTPGRASLAVVVAAHYVCTISAAAGTSLVGTLAFGLALCALCGVIAAYYLQALARHVARDARGRSFGGAYALSTVITWLLSLAPATLGGGVPTMAVVGAALSALSALLALREPAADVRATASARGDSAATPGRAAGGGAAGPAPQAGGRIVAVAGLAVLFMSLVKNVGYGFPTADLAGGVSMEATRLAYAVGLVAAGIVNDRSRRHGLILCLAALVTPFALLLVSTSGEPVSVAALWMGDYLLFGFFSVFRVVLFCDLAEDGGELSLAGLGLLLGRTGDALGTAICLALGSSAAMLAVVATALFSVTVPAALALFQHLSRADGGEGQAGAARSEQEVFEAFATRHGLSRREREVLREVLAERTNAEAAARLFVAESTVKYHVRNLLRKTGCKNRLELMALYTDERTVMP